MDAGMASVGCVRFLRFLRPGGERTGEIDENGAFDPLKLDNINLVPPVDIPNRVEHTLRLTQEETGVRLTK